MTLDEARERIGHKVVYRAGVHRKNYASTEEGVITSVNDHYVFVRYGADTGSKATYPGSPGSSRPACLRARDWTMRTRAPNPVQAAAMRA